MDVVTIRPDDAEALIDRITANDNFIFSVTCQRRTDLTLKYPPLRDMDRGKDAYVGDHSLLDSREYVKGSRQKIILQPKGTIRTMIVKGKHNGQSMKHWESKGGRLPYNPKNKGLKLVAGMYNDASKDMGTGTRVGRHGDWRPWAMICLRTVSCIVHNNVTYIVR